MEKKTADEDGDSRRGVIDCLGDGGTRRGGTQTPPFLSFSLHLSISLPHPIPLRSIRYLVDTWRGAAPSHHGTTHHRHQTLWERKWPLACGSSAFRACSARETRELDVICLPFGLTRARALAWIVVFFFFFFSFLVHA